MKSMLEKIFSDAENEVQKDVIDAAKSRYKIKLRELNSAKKVLANIERDIEELKLEFADGF